MTEKRVTTPLYVRLTADERKRADKVARDTNHRRTGDWAYKLVMDACKKHEAEIEKPQDPENLLDQYERVANMAEAKDES